jgi:hypothetical protein
MTKELPLYTCHKKVRALEIRTIGNYSYEPSPEARLVREVVFADPDYPPLKLDESLFARYVPMPGDYYVVYEDGYASFSPRTVFLEGYTPEGQIIQREQTEVDRLRAILRQCVRGPDFADLGNGEGLFLHLPHKGGIAELKQEHKS